MGGTGALVLIVCLGLDALCGKVGYDLPVVSLRIELQ